MKYYSLDVKDVIDYLNSSDLGLLQKDVEIRLKKDGKNKLVESKKEPKIVKFLNEFKNLMIVVLIISAIISFVLSILNNKPFTDSIIILAIVVLNALLGFIQELKADKSIESLKKMQVSKVKVKRENIIYIVNSEDVVRGDILVLEAGDTIPADARIIWEASLKVDESSLTGESIPVSKNIITLDEDTPLSLRKNMIYSGTHIVYGKCLAVVCEIGMNTEFGIIAKSLNKGEKEITPLQKKIDEISKFLSLIIAVIIVIVFFMGIVKGMNIMEVIILSISLAVAAIPEGLPAVITIILSIGMNSMAKKKAIVRKMSSVETLGCTEIICSDKTGTITQNKMKVREIYFNNKICKASELNKDNILFNIMILDNDVEKNNDEYIGDPTEIALYECCEKYFDVMKLRNDNKRIDELPFDSNRKMMSTINKNENTIKLYTKGSFDSLIKHCSYIYEDEEIVKLTEDKILNLKQIETIESNKAYRILAYAYKEIDNSYILDNNLENDLIFVGMTAMIDPPRLDVKDAIEQCKAAHIKPIMITGDSLSTATSIAREIGILESDEEAISGEYLDKMSESELKENVNKFSVYARVSPMNKLAIVNAWKQNNKVVAMTGDGVNDAPALKSANIGVGMGITGTEVSKSVSDIILSDDSFSTIITAVKEGRRIYDNIRNVLVYLLTGNIAEVLVVFIGMVFGIEIFLPIQLLYINLITDSIPAIALAFEKEEKNIMKRNIRKKDSSFFTPFLIVKMSLSAILKTIAILLVYFLNLKLYNIEIATTMSFLTLILLEMICAYSCRNLKKSVIDKNIFSNSYINKSIILLGIIQVIIFTTPLKNIFNIVSLDLLQFIYCFIIVIFIFLIDEVSKSWINKIFKD
ncbi:MAG: cation-translocating P-type ATPase [Bacilli bacterium]